MPVQQLVSSRDYPLDVVARRASGRSLAVVRLDAQGRPSDCRIVHSSGTKSLDDASCMVMLRARFRPARDKAGRLMESVFPLQLSWRIMG